MPPQTQLKEEIKRVKMENTRRIEAEAEAKLAQMKKVVLKAMTTPVRRYCFASLALSPPLALHLTHPHWCT